jgi:serine/threonine protein phosphatase PrpC
MKYSFFGKTDVGLVRQANEDSIGYQDMPWGKVIVLCDGMGGHRGGATASGIAVRCILEYFNSSEVDSIPEALESSVSFANEQIFATALDDPELKGMGTTCVVLVLKEEEIWIAHVGDSRAYLFHPHQLHRITRDHSFVQQLVDAGAISDEEAEHHPRKNELLSALGIRPEVTVEVTKEAILLAAGDTILLCSDGLNGMISDSQISLLMSSSNDLSEICANLIEAAKDGGGTDNVSVQLLHIEQSPHQKSRFLPILPPPDRATTNPHGESVKAIEPPPRSNSKKIYLYGLIGICILIAGFFLIRMVLTPAPPAPKIKTAEQAEEVAVKRLIYVYTYYNSGYAGSEGKACQKSIYDGYVKGECKIGKTLELDCIKAIRRSILKCGEKAPAVDPKSLVPDSEEVPGDSAKKKDGDKTASPKASTPKQSEKPK